MLTTCSWVSRDKIQVHFQHDAKKLISFIDTALFTLDVTEKPYEKVYLFPYSPESLLDNAMNEKESKKKQKE